MHSLIPLKKMYTCINLIVSPFQFRAVGSFLLLPIAQLHNDCRIVMSSHNKRGSVCHLSKNTSKNASDVTFENKFVYTGVAVAIALSRSHILLANGS